MTGTGRAVGSFVVHRQSHLATTVSDIPAALRLASLFAGPAPVGPVASLLDELPAAIYMVDPTRHIIYYNDAMVSLWGQCPSIGEREDAGSWRYCDPDGHCIAPEKYPIALAIEQCRSIRGTELLIERSDGTRKPVLPHPTPLFDSAGTVVGVVDLLDDLTQIRECDALRARLAAVVASSTDAIITAALDGTIDGWNGAAAHMLGYVAEDMLGRSVDRIVPEDRRLEEAEIMARVANAERVEPYETIRLRQDGSALSVSVAVSPIKDLDGRVIGASRIARDISDQKRARELQSMMLGEMQHRVKNLMAVIEALGRGSLPRNDAAIEAFWTAFSARVRVLLSAGEYVLESSSRSGDLRRIIEMALAPFAEPRTPNRILVEGPTLILSERTLGSLALAFHELATNALKYGALSRADGTVELKWSVASQRVLINWKERPSFLVSKPQRSGFGRRVIEAAVAHEHDSSVDLSFEPDGLRCSFAFSLSG